jgi:aminomethyltransferase
MLVMAQDGGIVNDPVLLHVDENVWWMQLADSDAGLYAMGVLSGSGLDAEVSYPDVHPVQVQGPHAASTLAKLVGDAIYDIRYYWCERFEIGDIPVVISRTGWSAVPGFEVNLLDGTRGSELWDAIMSAGEEFGIRPIAPNEARRVEAGIFNWGSDMTLKDTPFHVMGLERLVEEQPQDYLGKAALERVRREGVDRKLVGIEFDRDEPFSGITVSWPASHAGVSVGRVTDAVWSPGLSKNIGYVWVPIDLAGPGTPIDVDSEHGPVSGRTAAIPFVDPRKERPAASLRGAAG